MCRESRGGIELKENVTLRSYDIMPSSLIVRLFSREYLSILVHSKRNESSPRQRTELFECLAGNMVYSKRNASSHRQRTVQTVDDDYFRPYRGLNEQSIYSQSIFIWQTRVWSVEMYCCIFWHCAWPLIISLEYDCSSFSLALLPRWIKTNK